MVFHVSLTFKSFNHEKYCRDYSKYDKETFKQDLRNAPWINVIAEKSFNTAWSLFKNILTDIINKYAPVKVKLVRGKSSPWMTSTIRTSIKNRDFHLKKARRTNSERNLKVYRRLRNFVTNQIRSAKANYQRNLLKEEADNPKKFWDQIRKCYPSTSKTDKPPQSFQHNNTEITNKKDIANCFCSFFTHVGKTFKIQ